MSTHVSSSSLQDSEQALCVDFSQVTQLATGNATGSISIFVRPASSEQWTHAHSFKAHDAPVIQVAIGPSGNTIASTDGSVINLWRLQTEEQGKTRWALQAALALEGGVAALRFTVNADGTLCLAVAADDATIRIFQPSSYHADGPWRLHSVIHSCCTTRDSSLRCTASIAWKPSSYADVQLGVPAMLVVGSPSDGATVWWHDTQHDRWLRGSHLSDKQTSEEVAAVAWAPPNGRPAHLIAIAYGSSVSIWHVSGPADSLQKEQVADLKTSGQVWQMEFNSTGTWLAASVHGGVVQLFRPVLDGSWQLLSEIRGEESNNTSMVS